jgi:hypothetical protein
MRNTVLALAGILMLVGIAVGQAWVAGPQSPFGYCRFDGEYFPAKAMVYFLGGRIGVSTTVGHVYSYTPLTGAYADVGTDMRLAVSNYDVCLLRDDHDLPAGDTYGLYVVGGRYDVAPNYIDSVQVYYPTSNTAEMLHTDPFPGRVGGEITVAMSAIVYDNLMYVIGGFSQTGNATSAEAYSFDPLAPAGSRWSRLADMPLARAYPIVGIVDSFLYACGGDSWRSPDSLMAQTECQRLNLNDTAAGWTAIASLPATNSQARGFGFDTDDPGEFAGKVIVAGRGVWPSESTHCYIYDAARDSWASFPSLAQRRRNHAGVYIPVEAGGIGVPGIWVFGGRQDQDTLCLQVSEFYVINPVGVEESHKPQASSFKLAATVVRGVLSLSANGGWRMARGELLDIQGRKVLDLHAGANDVRALTPGVYLVRSEPSAVSGRPSAVTKVVVTR